MSSPIAKTEHSQLSARLIRMHQRLSHGDRIRVLAAALAETLRSLTVYHRCIDIGCGDMQIAESLSAAVPESAWRCLDLYPLSDDLRAQPRWAKYLQFDGSRLPLQDQSVDVALFCDVLHHMPEGLPAQMLREAGRVARYVVIKDHFEYGWWSRSLLRAMDFVGNWAYGVTVPRRYFNKATFALAVEAAGMRVERLQVGVDLYAHLPVIRNVLRRDWHFIAILTAR